MAPQPLLRRRRELVDLSEAFAAGPRPRDDVDQALTPPPAAAPARPRPSTSRPRARSEIGRFRPRLSRAAGRPRRGSGTCHCGASRVDALLEVGIGVSRRYLDGLVADVGRS